MQDLRDKARWPKKNNKSSGGKDKSKWHTYHKDFGQLTKDWFSYKKQIIYLFSKGHLKELLVRKRDKINQKPQDPKNLPQIISSPHSDAKVIDFISGGSEIYWTSYSTTKRNEKNSKMEKEESTRTNVFPTNKKEISFYEDDMEDVLDP